MSTSRRRRIVVLGTAASNPYAGMAWMHMQIAAGLQRLGHEVYYFETTSAWPYDPIRQSPVGDSEYAIPYLARLCESFGLKGRWAYRRSYSDKEWFGLDRPAGEDLLAHGDAVLNIAGATRLAEEGLKVGRLVYVGTDPVLHELRLANGEAGVRSLIDEHDDVVTYGENIGHPECPIPALPRLRATTRQPVLLDLWTAGAPSNNAFTTVGNWKQGGEIEYKGETYSWSKDRELRKFIDLPRRLARPLEFATGLEQLPSADRSLLEENGWRLVDAQEFTTDPWAYREYVRASPGEFTVAKDQNVRLRSGWFAERSACYLAAGRPVITQDTGFGRSLPTGEGLFAYTTTAEILAAFEAIASDYPRHARAALAIAETYFRAETVLARLLDDLGV